MILRPRLSPTMDRFLASQFAGPFLVCLSAFTAAYLLGDIFNRFSDLTHYGGFSLLGFEYFFLKIPLMVSQVLPVACLTGVLLGFALLNRSGEVLACQQLGTSRLEMTIPVLAVAALISIANFALNETVVPFATRQAKYLYVVQMKKRHLRGVFANRRIWVREREGFLAADSYERAGGILRGVTLYQIGPDYQVQHIFHADSARWNGQGWDTSTVTRYTVGNAGVVSSTAGHLEVGITPADLSLLRLDPEEFTLWELNRYLAELRKKGLDPGGYVVDRDLKYATPLSCLIMVALGIALSLDPLPRTLSLGRSFGLAIVIGFGYWLALGLTSSLGRSGVLPAWVAAWGPNALFAAITLGVFLFGEER